MSKKDIKKAEEAKKKATKEAEKAAKEAKKATKKAKAEEDDWSPDEDSLRKAAELKASIETERLAKVAEKATKEAERVSNENTRFVSSFVAGVLDAVVKEYTPFIPRSSFTTQDSCVLFEQNKKRLLLRFRAVQEEKKAILKKGYVPDPNKL